mmetsp:Transcript_86537/g.176011  ORF Transcript_86537/g.176011 Transcript_86537/m.176011 type:complete len:86 (+) Transcript_86537:1901-2158(+)
MLVVFFRGLLSTSLSPPLSVAMDQTGTSNNGGRSVGTMVEVVPETADRASAPPWMQEIDVVAIATKITRGAILIVVLVIIDPKRK